MGLDDSVAQLFAVEVFKEREKTPSILQSPRFDQLPKNAEGFGVASLWWSSTLLSAATKYSFFSKPVGTDLWKRRLFRVVTGSTGFGRDKVNFLHSSLYGTVF